MTIPSLARQRWIPAVNISGQNVPPFAAVCLRGYEVNGDRWFLRIDKTPFDLIQLSDAVAYELNDDTRYLNAWPWQFRGYLAFNGPGRIDPGGRGVITQQMPAFARLDRDDYEHGTRLRPDRSWRLTEWDEEIPPTSYRVGLRLIQSRNSLGLVAALPSRSKLYEE